MSGLNLNSREWKGNNTYHENLFAKVTEAVCRAVPDRRRKEGANKAVDSVKRLPREPGEIEIILIQGRRGMVVKNINPQDS